MNNLKKFVVNYAPPKRYFVAICCLVIVNSFIQKVGPIYWNAGYYTYEYGLLNPWIKIYNNDSIGIRQLLYMLRNSKMGIEWIPQYIFIDALLIYLTMAAVNFVYCKIIKKSNK